MPTETLTTAQSVAQKHAGKYLTFDLHSESYGIEVMKVREIIGLTPITAVAQMPDYIKGVINLRGKIIPVIDLRLRFGFGEIQNTEPCCIIVVHVKLPEARTDPMGLVVDGVEEVITISANDIEETPEFGGQISTDYLLAIAKVRGVVKALLDIDKVIGAEGIAQINKVSA